MCVSVCMGVCGSGCAWMVFHLAYVCIHVYSTCVNKLHAYTHQRYTRADLLCSLLVRDSVLNTVRQ